MTRADVLNDLQAWLGTMYVHQASLRGVGSDCLGLVGGIARDRGTPEGLAWAQDATFRGYGPTPVGRHLIAGTERYLDRIPVQQAGAGDILLMRFADDPQHFAILSRVEPVPYIVHASRGHGRVVEHRLDDWWRARVVRAYRYRGLTA